MTAEGIRLYDAQGRRKYLTPAERKAFLAVAERSPGKIRSLCFVLAYTGCRISEALALPLPLLRPCVAAIDELARNYGASIVLCTATQPALERDDPASSFRGGLRDVREIAPEPRRLYAALKRVTVRRSAEPLGDEQLAGELAGREQVLCIVNSRAHARALFEAIKEHEGARHLSTLMCAAHRAPVLDDIRSALQEGRPCRVVSTSLIECGVDVDFPRTGRSRS